MTRNENQMYSDITSIRKSLEKIANALETNVPTTPKPKDIPGFEGTLDALDVLTDIKTITDDYASKENLANMTEARDYYKEKFENTLTPTSDNPDPAGYGNAYETDLQGIRVDSDHDIRSTAQYYNDEIHPASNIKTKKDAILDYVTNEFGLHGARYTDIIKFAYYLNGPNKLKYTSEDRGYYSCAFHTGYGGHLIQGGKDCLVKGINKEGKERYFALSSVDNFTDFYRGIA
tara:strand:- start:65 stop:760 length:696 start_codon:yes stop_codon:yes gene_type:complete